MYLNHLYISCDKFVYCRLECLLWSTGKLSNEMREPLISSFEALLSIYERIDTDRPLVLSMKRIHTVQNRAFETFLEEVNNSNLNRSIIFTHLNPGSGSNPTPSYGNVFKELENEITKFDFKKITDGSIKIDYDDTQIPPNLIEEIEEIENRVIFNSVKSSYKEYQEEQELDSSTIIAPGEFDATTIISSPKSFMWTSCLLADRFQELIVDVKEEHLRDNPNERINIRILSVSLRGCTFAASVASLTQYRLDLIDHLGPRHKLLDFELMNNHDRKIRYIYIGDFTIGGTEIKIAQTYTNLLDCKMSDALVIGSLFKESAFSKYFKLTSLVRLKDVKNDLEYKLPI